MSPPSFRQWLRATWQGWLLGIPCIVVLALLAEAVYLGGLQVFVGAGMGAGVGLLQARVLRRHSVPGRPWFAATVLGLALPFLVWDLAQARGAEWTYSLAACVAVGGLTVGIAQAFVLRRRLSGTVQWCLASAAGYGLAGLLVTIADLLVKGHMMRGALGALLYVGLVALPGGIVGAVTAWPLVTKWRTPAV